MTNLYDRIQSYYGTMTKSQKKVAIYIIDHINTIAFCTLDELSKRIGVSTTTIIRFARAIGLAGYAELQAQVQSSIEYKASLTDRLKKTSESISEDRLLVTSFQQDIHNIYTTYKTISHQKVKDAVDLIVHAKTTFVVGFRTAYGISHFAATALGQVKKNVRIIHSAGGSFPEELTGIQEGDVCLAVTFPRYYRLTLDIVSWLKDRGVKIILITGPKYREIQNLGDIILPCSIDGTYLKDSLVAPLCLINYLATAVLASNKEEAMQVVSDVEKIFDHGDLFEQFLQ